LEVGNSGDIAGFFFPVCQQYASFNFYNNYLLISILTTKTPFYTSGFQNGRLKTGAVTSRSRQQPQATA
jgi:hypothetical protein